MLHEQIITVDNTRTANSRAQKPGSPRRDSGDAAVTCSWVETPPLEILAGRLFCKWGFPGHLSAFGRRNP